MMPKMFKSLTLTKKTTGLENVPKKKCAPAILSKTNNGDTLANSTPKKVRQNVLAVQPQQPLTKSSRVSLLKKGELPVLTEEVLCVLEMPDNKITAKDAHRLLGVIDQHPEINEYMSDNAWSTMPYHPFHEIIGDLTRSPGSHYELNSDIPWATNTYYENTGYLSQAATTSSESSDDALRLRITDDKPMLPMTFDEIKAGLSEMYVTDDDDDDDVIFISNVSKIARVQDKATSNFSRRESLNDQVIINTSNVAMTCSSSINTFSESTNNDKNMSNLSIISTNNEATHDCPQKVELDDEILVDYSKVSRVYNVTASNIPHIAMDSDMTFGDLSKITVPKAEPTTETNNTTTDNFVCGFSRMAVTQSKKNSESLPTMMTSNKTFDDVSRISGICNESSSYLTKSTMAVRFNSDSRMPTLNHGTTNNSSIAAIASDNTITNLPNITVSQHETIEDLKDLKPEEPSERTTGAGRPVQTSSLCDEVVASVRVARSTTRSVKGRRYCGPARGHRQPGDSWALPFALLTIRIDSKDDYRPPCAPQPPPKPHSSTASSYYLRKRDHDVFYADGGEDISFAPSPAPRKTPKRSRKKPTHKEY